MRFASPKISPYFQVVKRRPASAQGLLAPVEGTMQENVEVIHQRNYHKLDRGVAPADFHYHQQGLNAGALLLIE